MLLQKNNQFGATMIEAIGVLGIISMLTVSVISLIGNIFAMFNQAIIVNQVKDLQKVITERYRFDGNYSRLLEGRTSEEIAAFLCKEKMAPFQMCAGDGLLRHKGGGAVWVMPVENYDDEGNSFNDYNKYVLMFWGLSNKVCTDAAQINWYSQKKSDIYRMRINPDTEKQLIVNAPLTDGAVSEEEGENVATFPVPVAKVYNACSNGDDNQIEWIFY